VTVTVHHGDSREVLKTLDDASVDSCVTDAPYALTAILKRFGADGAAPAKSKGKSGVYKRASSGFMGQRWDTGETAHDPAFWAEVFRVLKPGGHVVAFSGTRTQHRQTCAIEDAGFEIRDQIGWVFGSGFPKSHNQKGDWEGWGSALKPAWEPICVARKPLVGSIAVNLAAHGVGALNIDGCRIHAGDAQGGEYVVKRLKPGATLEKSGGNWRPEQGGVEYVGNMKPGRWPANIVHDGSEEVVAAFPAEAGAFAPVRGTEPSNATNNVYGEH
jgi:site-specific DNA-methyltransferase (adenine-specific)